MQRCLNGASRLRRSTTESAELGIVAFCRPQRQQSVAGELHDVAAVRGDQLDEVAKVRIEEGAQLLSARCSARSQTFGQSSRARDVDEEGSAGQGIGERHSRFAASPRELPPHESRNVRSQVIGGCGHAGPTAYHGARQGAASC